jgi:hypothetical protein
MCLSRYSFRVSQLHKSLFYRHFAVYLNHFRIARTSVLYIFYYTVPVTVLQIRRSYLSRPHATTLHTPSQYISSSTIYIRYRIVSRVSRLRTFQLAGTLPYTGFTFDSPKHQSSIPLYMIDSLFDIYQLRFFFCSLSSGTSSLLKSATSLSSPVPNLRPNQSSFLVLYDTCSLFLH